MARLGRLACATARFGVPLLILLVGCAPDFVPAWEVKKPRLMVAKVVIDGDTENRARPRAGETFSIEMYMMSAEAPRAHYTGAITTCLGTVLPDGTLGCADDMNFTEISTQPYAGDDRLVFSGFVVPPFLDELPPPLDMLERVSLLGALCADGQIERVPGTSVAKDPISTLYRCVDNEDSDYQTQLPFTMSVWVDRDTLESQANHHPTFACDEADGTGACNEGVEHDDEQVPGSFVMRLPTKVAGDGPRSFAWEPWDGTEGELPWDNCAEAPETLPRIHVGDEEHEIYLRFDASDRETYRRRVKVNDEYQFEERREELVVTHALTTKGGRLDGYTSVVRLDKEDAEAEAILKYSPPPKPNPKKKKSVKDPVPPEGRLVRFYFGLRDQRGGVDFTTRELCLLPYEESAADASDD
jgi:hypothetical protein